MNATDLRRDLPNDHLDDRIDRALRSLDVGGIVINDQNDGFLFFHKIPISCLPIRCFDYRNGQADNDSRTVLAIHDAARPASPPDNGVYCGKPQPHAGNFSCEIFFTLIIWQPGCG